MKSALLGKAVRWGSGVAKVLYFLAGVVVIFAVAYLLGHTLLTGSLKGGDSPMHVGYALWLDEYFPRIPHWYPLQGGGESLLHGYPILPHLILVLLHRLSGVSILQLYRLVSFLSFPLTALGLYLFCWACLERQTVGLIAAVLYLLAPVTWTWMADWGFYGQQVGMVFLPLALATFDRTLGTQLAERRDGRRRIWLVVLVVLVLLATLCHMLVGVAAAAGMALYTLFGCLTAQRGDRRAILVTGAKILLRVGFGVGLVAAAYLVPFYLYGRVAGREGLNAPGVEQLHRLSIAQFFGLHPIDPQQVLTRMQFPLVVSVFALVGVALACVHLRSVVAATARKALALGLACAGGAVFVLSPGLVAIVLRLSPLLMDFVNFRSLLLLVTFLFPTMAAFGIWALAYTLLHPERLLRSDEGIPRSERFPVRRVLVPLAALGIAWAAILPGMRLFSVDPWMLPYGAASKIDLRDVWGRRAFDSCLGAGQDARHVALCGVKEARQRLNVEEFFQACDLERDSGGTPPALCTEPAPTAAAVEAFLVQCAREGPAGAAASPCGAIVQSLARQLAPIEWPALSVADGDPVIESVQRLASLLPTGSMLRVDVSAYHGRLAQDLPFYAGASQIESYTQQLSLIHLMWGYQLGVFYSQGTGSPEAVNDLADWMGIQYVFLDPERDPLDRYQTPDWQPVYEGPAYGSREVTLLRYLPALDMATVTQRPSILVIGSAEKAVYPQVFQLANEGVARYDEALLIEGNAQVDGYSLQELERFDVLLLDGYTYRDSERAWSLLDDYVRQGGGLFIDTGWQYTVPEWEFRQAPSVLPVERLTWQDYGQAGPYVLGDSPIAAGVDASRFSPLIWEQDPWSVSGASMEDVREWGTPILSVDGHPLIVAGEYGQGRVVWSGMNFINHIRAYSNADETLLLHGILEWLEGSAERQEFDSPIVVRSYPDEAYIAASGVPGHVTWLYWREAYYPDWHAYLTDSSGRREIPIYRAGPGFMLMPIETNAPEVSVTLTWELSPIEKASVMLSCIGSALLAALLLDGLFLGGNGFTWLKIALAMRFPRPLLADGANVEWAEKKKAEIAAHRRKKHAIGEEPPSTEAVPLAPPVSASVLPGSERGQPSVPVDVAFTAGNADEDEPLLQSWLAQTGHREDEWAHKILGRRRSGKGSGQSGETDPDSQTMR